MKQTDVGGRPTNKNRDFICVWILRRKYFKAYSFHTKHVRQLTATGGRSMKSRSGMNRRALIKAGAKVLPALATLGIANRRRFRPRSRGMGLLRKLQGGLRGLLR